MHHIARVLVEHEGRILLLERSATDPFRPGHWSFPGGIVRSDESPLEAAMRETLEETGITIALRGDPWLVFRWPDRKSDSIISTTHIYRATVPRKTVTLNYEHSAFRWLHPEEVGDLPLLPSAHAAFTHLRGETTELKVIY